MATIKIPTFAGMLPAADDRLLPDVAAAYAENCWLYAGAVRGLPTPRLIHTLVSAGTQKVYRVPNNLANSENMYEATFLEFADINTDIIRAPVFEDSFQRYYFVSEGVAPKYNTTARIEYSANPASSDITAAVTDLITWTGHTLVAGDPLQFTTTGTLPAGLSLATTYYVSADGLAANVFKVATTYAAAIEAAVVVDITDTGTGTHTATTQDQPAWLLGIPIPAAPSVSPSGGSGATETRSYVVTWVTAYGEEGPPSLPHTLDGKVDDTWTVTLPTVAADDKGVDRNLRNVRIYRTIVSASGVATFFLVTELDIWDTSHADTATDETVSDNSQLQSTNWTAPPADLSGFILMGNGIIAGFRDNELWFTEAYRPHAWPSAYVRTVEYPIVGLGVANQALVVCTTGNPVTATGVNPAYITTTTFPGIEPCVSRGSIVSAPEGVYYASLSGLVLANAGSIRNITKEMITRDKWQELTDGSALKAARFGNSYFAYGALLSGAFETTAFEVTAFTQEDESNAFLGVMIDPFSDRAGFSRLRSDDPVASVITDPWTGEVMIIRDGGVYWIDQGDLTLTNEPFVWTSKIFQTSVPQNFSAMKVFFEIPTPVPGDFGTIKVYADGVLRTTKSLVTSGALMRLPSGFLAEFWQFKLETSLKILSVHVATSPEELKRL